MSTEKLPARKTIREAILDFFKVRGEFGLTADEVEEFTSLPHQTASARVNDLKKEELIVDSGKKRKTRRGRDATVWKLNK